MRWPKIVALGLVLSGCGMEGSLPVAWAEVEPDAPADAGARPDAGAPWAELAWSVCCGADGGCFLFDLPTCPPPS